MKTSFPKFRSVSESQDTCSSDFWNECDLELVQKDPKFPKVPKKTGKPLSSEYKALHNIARRIRPLVRASLVRGINSFRKNIDLNDLAAAISNADPAEAMNVVPWDDFSGAVKGLNKVTLDGVSESARQSKFLFRRAINRLVPGLNPDVVFDPSNPAIKNWIDNHLGELVTNIRTETQKSIQGIMSTAMREGIPPRESAKLIREIVGLNERQAMATMNRRSALMKSGFKGKRLDEAIEAYTQKQLKYRSELIARTEAMTANNRGMMEVANQNADAGLFDRSKAKKVWIVTPYDRLCKICAPMANKKVGIDESFTLRNGKSVSHPPAHPNCNCGWALELPEGSQ